MYPTYGGYSPLAGKFNRKLPVTLQFHGGRFVSGSNESVGNDAFYRRNAKLCDVIVVAVDNRLARRVDTRVRMGSSFGASMLEPWLATYGDPSRCVLLWVCAGAKKVDYVARKAIKAGKLLDPIRLWHRF
ncbi:hypothetical protein GH714_017638 [Hevea brasiliensis]|uniref:Alpha/beta hydrolase fold-3 domain-containing protein n=1 Tax=Hevea brasiliensis TaxID=3981 RepID=A0A6A6KDQ8_HEVBR|nr:hypothetical protein GH714_017638 [Hevea brasiliensis]